MYLSIDGRIKVLLPLFFSSNQVGYVQGRQIMDNIILSYEMVHSLKNLRKLGMMMQLDISKGFTKLNWNYMHEVLLPLDSTRTA